MADQNLLDSLNSGTGWWELKSNGDVIFYDAGTTERLRIVKSSGKLEVSGAFETSGAAQVAGFTATGAAALQSTLDVTGATALSSTLAVTGQSNLSGGYDLGTNAPVRKFVRTSLSAAQIQALNATPVQILAAAANKAYVPISAFYRYTHVANAYDDVGAGEDFRIQWKTGTVQALQDMDTTSDINMGTAASDECHIAQIAKSKPVTNSDLEVTILSGEIYSAAGDGTMIIDLVYDEYTV